MLSRIMAVHHSSLSGRALLFIMVYMMIHNGRTTYFYSSSKLNIPSVPTAFQQVGKLTSNLEKDLSEAQTDSFETKKCECGGVAKPGVKCDVCVLCGRGNDRILTVSKENIRGQVIFTKINLKCTACAFIVRCTSISPPSQQSAATNLNVKTPLFCRGRRVGRLKCSSPLLTRWLLTAQLVGAGSNTEVHTTQTQTLMAGWQTVLIS